ncbi:Rcs stress response system protein RcsF [Shewanella sedimentimangrovi]|uniref:Lipoprotein n=1 Tax=Shewanella sedimentimangrovi TaxID=2814293 RepID=A0ABX7R3G7_9GAMM|nr:Rcs stress response system protein RcsF [Shewanella sedimentimangrovi]QSX38328.1 hypothetical protein JYB85_05750 [Shewanella sedimentimangrovi]
MKAALPLLLVPVLGGCAGYQFNSNLDGKAIKDYFKAGDVQLFEGDARPTVRYEVIGLVEGHACQAQPQDVPVTLADARTHARRQAADQGANGLIIRQCTLITEPSPGCVTSAMCVGQAIRQQQE